MAAANASIGVSRDAFIQCDISATGGFEDKHSI